MDRGACWTTVHGVANSGTRMSDINIDIWFTGVSTLSDTGGGVVLVWPRPYSQVQEGPWIELPVKASGSMKIHSMV